MEGLEDFEDFSFDCDSLLKLQQIIVFRHSLVEHIRLYILIKTISEEPRGDLVEQSQKLVAKIEDKMLFYIFILHLSLHKSYHFLCC